MTPTPITAYSIPYSDDNISERLSTSVFDFGDLKFKLIISIFFLCLRKAVLMILLQLQTIRKICSVLGAMAVLKRTKKKGFSEIRTRYGLSIWLKIGEKEGFNHCHVVLKFHGTGVSR